MPLFNLLHHSFRSQFLYFILHAFTFFSLLLSLSVLFQHIDLRASLFHEIASFTSSLKCHISPLPLLHHFYPYTLSHARKPTFIKYRHKFVTQASTNSLTCSSNHFLIIFQQTYLSSLNVCLSDYFHHFPLIYIC